MSSKSSSTRGLFRWDEESGKPVFVREEEYSEVFWREEKKDEEAR